jgi:exopolyphosphatase/guanosine-5'-triphosphate,3'-diphosphate pyrophosphatase
MTVVARWEWRIFGDGFGAAERRLTSTAPERVDDTDEVYLLGLGSDASVKVRDRLLDAKRLLRVDRDGLEQWLPITKAVFPASPADLAAVLALLGVSEERGAGGADTVEALLALVEELPEVRAVPVHKHREHYTFAGCMAECSEFRTAAGAIRTLAVESPDPGRVAAAVAALGLTARPVVSVPRALKALIGFGAPRAAVIDIGTNSVKFHVGERSSEGNWRTVVDRADVTRLGEGLAGAGRLTPTAIARTVDTVVANAGNARRLGASRIAAVGTAGLRMAPNAHVLVDAVRDRCGVEVEILPAEEEARLAYAAALAGLDISGDVLVVFDTGGGSTQFTFSHGSKVDERFSLNLGAVRLTEHFGLHDAVSPDNLAAALRAVEVELAALRGRGRADAVVGMGGAVTNLAAVRHELRAYDADVVHGTVLDRVEIERQLELYRVRSAEQRREIDGLQPARAEVILAGACVVRSVLVLLDVPALTVSDRGLRHGLIAERFGRGAGGPARPHAVA